MDDESGRVVVTNAKLQVTTIWDYALIYKHPAILNTVV